MHPKIFDYSVNLVLVFFIKPAFCESTFHFSFIVVKIILRKVIKVVTFNNLNNYRF